MQEMDGVVFGGFCTWTASHQGSPFPPAVMQLYIGKIAALGIGKNIKWNQGMWGLFHQEKRIHSPLFEEKDLALSTLPTPTMNRPSARPQRCSVNFQSCPSQKSHTALVGQRVGRRKLSLPSVADTQAMLSSFCTQGPQSVAPGADASFRTSSGRKQVLLPTLKAHTN